MIENDRYVVLGCDGLFDVYQGCEDKIQTFIDARLEDNQNNNRALDQVMFLFLFSIVVIVLIVATVVIIVVGGVLFGICI